MANQPRQGLGEKGPPDQTLGLVIFVVIGAPVLVLSLILGIFWHPQIDEDFLFLYFGIATALAVAVSSTLVLADERDKVNFVLVLTILFDVASLSSLAGAVFGPGHSRPLPLVVSLVPRCRAGVPVHPYGQLPEHEVR